MSHLFKASLLISVFFAVNKLVALVRHFLIVKQFGLSSAIDAFNVSNNVPDLVFSVFSGGALALAFIPVFAEYISEYGKIHSWKLFSRTANIVFLITAVASLVFAFFAEPLVTSNLGIAPGFSPTQQMLVVDLMRINLIATLIFSLSGLAMASLQAHKHFLLPALAPILYNVGQIIGVVIFADWLNLGVYGLAYGVVLGSFLHFAIQIPGMLRYGFRWTPSFGFADPGVRKILRLMLPRIATVLLIQIIFLSRDNLASRLSEGAVSALTYGYFIMQVPETLIGTAIATALLPTLSEFVTQKKKEAFALTVQNAMRLVFSASLIATVLLSLTVDHMIRIFFDFSPAQTDLLVWTTRGFLIGLVAQTALEVVIRAFYAKQNATIPLIATGVRTMIFLAWAIYLHTTLGATGLALADSLGVAIEVVILFVLLYPTLSNFSPFMSTLIRSIVGCFISAGIVLAVFTFLPLPPLMQLIFALLAGGGTYVLFVKEELRLIVRL